MGGRGGRRPAASARAACSAVCGSGGGERVSAPDGEGGGGRALRGRGVASPAGGDGPGGGGAAAGRAVRARVFRRAHDCPAAALVRALHRGAVRAHSGGGRGGGARGGARGGQQGGIRAHGGHLLEAGRGGG